MIHPDGAVRDAQTAAAVALIGRAPELGATAVTLCTGTRDPDNMWRRHPGNDEPAAWQDLRASLDRLLPAAAAAGVRLGIEPEPANVISDAARARRLLDELGGDAGLTGIIFDPANLVTVETAGNQADILRNAATLLARSIFCVHAKDVVVSGYAAAGTGRLDYGLIFELLAGMPAGTPLIVQDAAEDDVARVRDFLLAHSAESGAGGLRVPEPRRRPRGWRRPATPGRPTSAATAPGSSAPERRGRGSRCCSCTGWAVTAPSPGRCWTAALACAASPLTCGLTAPPATSGRTTPSPSTAWPMTWSPCWTGSGCTGR
jgi:sugar phosphate isomerase/epimerase